MIAALADGRLDPAVLPLASATNVAPVEVHPLSEAKARSDAAAVQAARRRTLRIPVFTVIKPTPSVNAARADAVDCRRMDTSSLQAAQAAHPTGSPTARVRLELTSFRKRLY